MIFFAMGWLGRHNDTIIEMRMIKGKLVFDIERMLHCFIDLYHVHIQCDVLCISYRKCDLHNDECIKCESLSDSNITNLSPKFSDQ